MNDSFAILSDVALAASSRQFLTESLHRIGAGALIADTAAFRQFRNDARAVPFRDAFMQRVKQAVAKGFLCWRGKIADLRPGAAGTGHVRQPAVLRLPPQEQPSGPYSPSIHPRST